MSNQSILLRSNSHFSLSTTFKPDYKLICSSVKFGQFDSVSNLEGSNALELQTKTFYTAAPLNKTSIEIYDYDSQAMIIFDWQNRKIVKNTHFQAQNQRNDVFTRRL